MKKSIIIGLLFSVACLGQFLTTRADTGPTLDTFKVVSTSTITPRVSTNVLNLPYLGSGTYCVHSVGGTLMATAGDCGTGGGGSSTLIFAGSYIGVTASGTNGYVISNLGVTSTLGNWQGTWQGVNSTTFYLASNPEGYVTSTGGVSTSSINNWSALQTFNGGIAFNTATGTSATSTISAGTGYFSNVYDNGVTSTQCDYSSATGLITGENCVLSLNNLTGNVLLQGTANQIAVASGSGNAVISIPSPLVVTTVQATTGNFTSTLTLGGANVLTSSTGLGIGNFSTSSVGQWANNGLYALQATTISSGGILTGGGALSGNQTISLSTTTLNTNINSLGYITSSSIAINGFSSSTFQLNGTSNQVVITQSPSGTLTFSTPQNIDTSASPQFQNLGLGVSGSATTLAVAGSFPNGAIEESAVKITTTVNPEGNFNGYGIKLAPTFSLNQNPSGTSTRIISLYLESSTVTNNTTGTKETDQLYINGTINGTTTDGNYAIHVAAGTSRFDAPIVASGTSIAATTITATTSITTAALTNTGAENALVLASSAGLQSAYGGAAACVNAGLVSGISATGTTICVTSSTQFTNLSLGTIAKFASTDYLTSSTAKVSSVNSITGAVVVAGTANQIGVSSSSQTITIAATNPFISPTIQATTGNFTSTLTLAGANVLTSAVTSANSITGATIFAGTANQIGVSSSSQTITFSVPSPLVVNTIQATTINATTTITVGGVAVSTSTGITGGSCTSCNLTYNGSGLITVAANGSGGGITAATSSISFTIEYPTASENDAIWIAPVAATITNCYAVNKTTGDSVTMGLGYASSRATATSSLTSVVAGVSVTATTTPATLSIVSSTPSAGYPLILWTTAASSTQLTVTCGVKM